MWEGEPPPGRQREDQQAIDVWNMLTTGSSSLDWRSLPFALEHFGISDDVEGLIDRLMTIKRHRPPPPPPPKED